MWFSDGICGRHLQIMVKTRGLGHALGRVIAIGLRRRDGDDSDGVPQRRRPTASAHKRRVPVIVDDVVHFNDEKLFAPMGHAFGVHG